ncbi:protein MRG1-like isoform X4 [Apium graveolens]|uniref:protein MRG1-like isoform X4 n=1 Tax=Apium graveolens TaxID=4045 RepID=UPI003D7958E5
MEMGRSNTTGDSGDCVDLTMNNESVYVEGEIVLAFHKGNWYEAKVQKVESRMDAWTYFVHYLGWKKRWDEWLNTEHLKKLNKVDVQKQLVQRGRSAMVKDLKPESARGKIGNSESFIEEKRSITDENLLNIEIPSTLKKQLLDDCEYVTHLGKLVKLPRTPNVDDILKKYFALRVKKNDNMFFGQEGVKL